ncbi:hypothetical protein PENCOP_c003G00515 [Penicillium coprophilum]|uniref:Tryptophan synthase beta chain-like PALP domain-containing protein n=1 Tax=Penicillium coprophilum TaxID=36646 RepID=A0A1V6UYX2_9EURO|nr:hypothetical protein PENCOP_c003G00515 [Penicillium coprophilum]
MPSPLEIAASSVQARSRISHHIYQTAQRRLLTASSGNHGIAATFASQTLSRNLTVVLLEIVISAKFDKIKSYGVDVILRGAETGLAEQHAQQLAASGITPTFPLQRL